jgi:hypothetical protein
MASTIAESAPQVGTTSLQAAIERRRQLRAVRKPTAFRLMDEQGHYAYLWWEQPGVPVVESEDAAFRRRVLRALKKPIWAIEDIPDEQGFPVTTRVQLQPEDPRYPVHLAWRWDKVGLGDLADVTIVRRHDKQPVERHMDRLMAELGL